METKLLTFLTTIACSFPSILIGQIKNSISQFFAEPAFNGEAISEPVYSEPLNLRSENFRHNCNHYEYFVNLGNHIGYNEKHATCGYVALAMLLCYYDTYYNPNIVSDSHTAYGNGSISPGTNMEPTSNTNSVLSYYDFLRNNKNTSLHSYLILKDKGALVSNPQFVETDFQDEFVTYHTTITSLADSYLDDLNFSNYTISSISKTDAFDPDQAEDIHNFIVSEINAGRPVFAGYAGHARVIYGYDDNRYYLHDGDVGHEESYFVHGGNGFRYQSANFAAISIQFESSEHVHSYNYFDDDVGNYYCACGTYKHIHDYTDHYVYLSSNYHLSYCECGAHITELHSYRINLHNNPCVCGGSVWGN